MVQESGIGSEGLRTASAAPVGRSFVAGGAGGGGEEACPGESGGGGKVMRVSVEDAWRGGRTGEGIFGCGCGWLGGGGGEAGNYCSGWEAHEAEKGLCPPRHPANGLIDKAPASSATPPDPARMQRTRCLKMQERKALLLFLLTRHDTPPPLHYLYHIPRSHPTFTSHHSHHLNPAYFWAQLKIG